MAIPDSSSSSLPDKQPAQPAAGVVIPARGASFSDALDSVTDSVQLIDANWRTIYLNKAARRTLREQGQDPDHVIGRHFWDEIYTDARGTALQRAYMHAMESREVTDLENFYPPWQRWFWVRVFPVEAGGIAVYFHDITDRKRTNQLLREQKEILSLIANGAPLERCLSAVTESVSRLSPGLRACVLLANPQIRYFEDCYSAQLPGSFAVAIRRQPISEMAIGTCSQAVFKGEPVACESIATDARWTQSWRWHCLEHGIQACHSEPIRGRSGQTIASLMLCFAEPRNINVWEQNVAKFACSVASVAIEHDRRERALREGEARFHRLADVMSVRLDEQRALISDYQRADQASKSASERKDEFLAILVHELRNPLVALASATNTLEKTEHRGEAASLAVTMVRRQVDHMSRLLEDLMNAARITHGLVQLRLEPLSMQDAIREAVEMMRHQIESRQHRLSLQLPEEGIYVHADAIRLNQIIVNLLSNAVKYTPMGGTIDVQLTQAHGAAVLVVRDDGMGIAPELLPKIFEMYTRGSFPGQDDGLGIGLALVKGLIELHQGAIEARSAGEGCGSEFIVTLPLDRGDG